LSSFAYLTFHSFSIENIYFGIKEENYTESFPKEGNIPQQEIFSFPNDDAAIKLLYLLLKNIQKKWTIPAREWGKALTQFAIIHSKRMPR